MRTLLLIVIALAISLFGYWLGIRSDVTPPLNESGTYYVIDIQMPVQTALESHSADVKARSIMYAALADIAGQFKGDTGVEGLTEEDARIQGLEGGRTYMLGAEYEEYRGRNTVSYTYHIYTDTLGAHPNHFYRTFTFGLTGEELMLKDIFEPHSQYLTRLSEETYVRVLEELAVRMNGDVYEGIGDTVRMGTAPSPETFQFFYITETDLHILFPPYQVAPYALGAFDIAIPLSDLGDMVRSQFK